MTLLAPGTRVRVQEQHHWRPGHTGVVIEFNEKKLRYLVEFDHEGIGFTEPGVKGKCLLLDRLSIEIVE